MVNIYSMSIRAKSRINAERSFRKKLPYEDPFHVGYTDNEGKYDVYFESEKMYKRVEE